MSKEKVKPNYYRGIYDMPIWNFDKLCSGGIDRDPKYLLKDFYDDIQEDFDPELQWEIIYNEYLKDYGLGDKYKEWCRLMKKVSAARHAAYHEDKKYMLTHAEIFEKQAQSLIESIEGGDLFDTCAAISKYTKYEVNPMTTSVKMFQSYLKQATKTRTDG